MVDHLEPLGKVTNWHSLTVEETFLRVESKEDGLSTEEATRRLSLYGPNVIKRKGNAGTLELLWRQINSPLIWVLIGSAALAMGLGKLADGAVVLSVVIINTIIGFVQEFRAGKAIDALSEMIPENAIALRDGKRMSISVAELVPGDIILLASGDKVPADARLVTGRNLKLEEATLTGESVPVEKSPRPVAEDAGIGDRTCVTYSGTLVTYGVGTAVVFATATRTELGRISTLLDEATNLQTPLTKALETISKIITIGVLAISTVMVAIGVIRMVAATIPVIDALKDTLIFAIALAVGAIPEGLPAIVTIALAIGVQRMAQRRAIVRKLPSVETLGSTTVICSDKTGTLTRNEMTVQSLWTPTGEFDVTGVGYEPTGTLEQDGKLVRTPPPAVHRLVENGALCSDATVYHEGGMWKLSGDPTEGALVTSALKFGIDVEPERKRQARIDAIPFESEHQFMATLHKSEGLPTRVIMKGAPEVLLRRCTAALGAELNTSVVQSAIEKLASRGMRVLAIADKQLEGDVERLTPTMVDSGMVLIGLAGMIDPPREEAIAAIKACHAAGITVKMITGDHAGTATAIGRQLGLMTEGRAITHGELQAASDDELRTMALSNNVFARVAPEHKLRLVRALQATDQVVAMTGDGVNDAPALKQSNIGVAMGITGTSVSKEAADIVLADDNFASIAAAVEEGRRVYDNLIKSLAFVLPTNLGLALILIYAVIFFPFDIASKQLLLPMSPVQLLWINLVAAVSLALPLAFEAKEPDIMSRPPRSPHEPVLSRFVIYRTVFAAIFMTAGAIGLFLYEYSTDVAAGVNVAAALAQAQTMTVTTVIAFQIFYMFNCRSLKGSIFKIGVFSNVTVFIGVGALLVLQGLFIYAPILNGLFGSAPIRPSDLVRALLVGATILPIISVEKWLRGRALRNP